MTTTVQQMTEGHVTDDVQRFLGQLDGRLSAVEERQDRDLRTTTDTLKAILARLDDLKQWQDNVNGGRKVLYIAATLAIGLLGAAVGFVSHGGR